jgi:hypothetical protein
LQLIELQKVKQQELKNSESEHDSMFYLFLMFFEFAVYNTFIHLFNMLWVSIEAVGRICLQSNWHRSFNIVQPVLQQVMIIKLSHVKFERQLNFK